MVDRELPLTIQPPVEELTRVFLGRVEIITPEMEQAVSNAVRSGNHAQAAKYGRLLPSIPARAGSAAKWDVSKPARCVSR
ncbi:MAG TPA: hypothetical protein VM120_25545 [Bryobacteraceae bacterium]|nr:hypothetical protein [Bryobacteraceae bacterium]